MKFADSKNIAGKLAMLFQDPSNFASKVISRLEGNLIDKHTKQFMRHNQKVWKGWANNAGSRLVLFDYYPVAETEIARSYLLNILAQKRKATIASIGLTRQHRNRKWRKIYQSFNVNRHVSPTPNTEQKHRSLDILRKIAPGLKTKKDIFELRIDDVWIGIDIYEEYLMRFTEPTIHLGDPRLSDLIKEGIETFVFWRDFFETHDVRAVSISQPLRMHNIILKTAGQLFHIPLYGAHARSISYWPKAGEFSHTFTEYRNQFKSFSTEKQKWGLEWAKKQISRRLEGEVGVDMPYSTKSAFASSGNTGPVLRKTDHIKVLICPHEFYDSPNCYGGLLFMDFYEWLVYLGELSQKTEYDWYIKTHRDLLPGAKEILERIIVKYPRFEMIPPDTSHYQLAAEGINFVLTCYGTVGHEYPLLGVQVINAGDNPHMAYDFNWNPKTLSEYEHMLLNLNSLKKEIKLDELYEFYFVHYGTSAVDDLVFRSYTQMLSELTEQQRVHTDIFSYFLNQLTQDRHLEIIRNFSDFIDSGEQFYSIYTELK